MTTIAVTGATGTVGGIAARLLTEAGHAPRLVVRDPSRAPDLPGTDVAVASYGDHAACLAAFAGIETLLLISGHEDPDRVAQHRCVIDAAAQAGVRHVVYTSFVGASATSGFLLGRDHAATEEHLRASGLTWTFLRDNFYAEVLPHFAGDDRAIRGPARGGRVAAVSQRDVGAVAAAVLADPAAHANTIYDLTGPEALTLSEVAQVLTDVTGRQYSYVDETLEEARASRAHLGAPEWLVDAWISTYTAIADGELEHVSADVAQVLGRPATAFADAVTMA